jgi:hypothetical protein
MPTAPTISQPSTVRATRYVAPLREGGSLPALVEASDDGLYVLKFRGAGQGPKALIAELVCGELGRRLGLPVPELAFVDVDPVLGRAEPDPEIQDLIAASEGLNFGLDYLPGSLTFDPAADSDVVNPELAASIVWFDAFTSNVDRTPRNPNLLVWHGRLWLIDHGAALYVHHDPRGLADHATRPFGPIADHVLLPFAGSIDAADARMAPALDRALLEDVVGLVPGQWLAEGESRSAYVDYFERRLAAPRAFAEEAERVRIATV